MSLSKLSISDRPLSLKAIDARTNGQVHSFISLYRSTSRYSHRSQKSVLAPSFELADSLFIYDPVSSCPLNNQVSVIRFIGPRKIKLDAYSTTLSHQIWSSVAFALAPLHQVHLWLLRECGVLTWTMMLPRSCFGPFDAQSIGRYIFSRVPANSILGLFHLRDRMSLKPSCVVISCLRGQSALIWRIPSVFCSHIIWSLLLLVGFLTHLMLHRVSHKVVCPQEAAFNSQM